jgi:4-aminobutyrate aminotransferase-like enzyme
MKKSINKIFKELESTGTKTFSLSEDPPIFVKGLGSTLTDSDGKNYIDMAGGSAVSILGHGHKNLTAALQKQLDTGISHLGPHFHTKSHIEIFKKLRGLLPKSFTHFHPATNGTEAIEVALKAAMYKTNCSQFLAFWGSYHGRTSGSLAVSSLKGGNNAKYGPYMPITQFLPYAIKVSDIEPFLEIARTTIKNNWTGSGPYAGIIMEPIQGSGGVRIPQKKFIKGIAKLAKETGIPLIFDEVFTGFGRTGNMFAHHYFEVEPDILVLSKAIGGGFPTGMVAAKNNFLNKWSSGTQSSTFQMHPFAAASGNALIEIIMKENLISRAKKIGNIFKKKEKEIKKLPFVKDFRGMGAMQGIEIQKNNKPDKKLTKKIRLEALKKGLITYECGINGNVIGLMPPLVITDNELNKGIEIIINSIKKS